MEVLRHLLHMLPAYMLDARVLDTCMPASVCITLSLAMRASQSYHVHSWHACQSIHLPLFAVLFADTDILSYHCVLICFALNTLNFCFM